MRVRILTGTYSCPPPVRNATDEGVEFYHNNYEFISKKLIDYVFKHPNLKPWDIVRIPLRKHYRITAIYFRFAGASEKDMAVVFRKITYHKAYPPMKDISPPCEGAMGINSNNN